MKPIDWDTTGLCEEHKAALRNIETIALCSCDEENVDIKVAAIYVYEALELLRMSVVNLEQSERDASSGQ